MKNIKDMKDKKIITLRNINAVTVIIFIVLVFGIAAANIINPDRLFSEVENRELQQQPKYSTKNLLSGKFTEDYETYITDQFIARDSFITVKTLSETTLGKKDSGSKSESSGVFFAKDGYLIEKHDEGKVDATRFATNTKRLSDFIKASNSLIDGSAKVMIVPTASVILTNKLPAFAPQLDQNKFIDTIKEAVQSDNFIDVRMALTAHNNDYIYYKTDHHWTTNGAFIAYQEFCKSNNIASLSRDEFDIKVVNDKFHGTLYAKANLPSTPYDEIINYTKKSPYSVSVEYNNDSKKHDSLYLPENLKKYDKYTYFLNGNNGYTKILTGNKNGKSILLIKDSFGHCFAPFLVNDYETIHMIDLRYYNMGVESFIKENNPNDVLVLYNAINFANDRDLSKLNR